MKTFRQGQPLLKLSEALQCIKALQPMSNAQVVIATEDSLGRVLAEDVFADEDLPTFRKSTMDGYGFAEMPVNDQYYPCEAVIEMGRLEAFDLAKDHCVYLPTGGQVPDGINWVLPVEGTRAEAKGVVVTKASLSATHWIAVGEDVQKGKKVLKAGQIIGPMTLGMLALIGRAEVKVYRKLKVGILTMGDELVSPFESCSPGKIRDINQMVLKGLVEKMGAEVVYCMRCKDDREALNQALRTSLSCCDLVISSGSSSMGSADFMPELIDALADDGLLFHGLNIKPGKPVGLGLRGEKRLLALPGNPVSTAMTFVLVAQPLMANMLGLRMQTHCVEAVLTQSCGSDGRETFIPVSLQQVGEQTLAHPHKGKSGLISQIASADGFFAIEAGAVAQKGDKVEVRLFGRDKLILEAVQNPYNPLGGINE